MVAGVELGRLAGVVSFRADEVGSVTEGLRGGGIATTGLDVTSSFLCFFDGGSSPSEGIYVERIHNKQSSKAIEKHQKKKRGLTRDDVGQGVIERCLGVVAVSSKGCVLLE